MHRQAKILHDTAVAVKPHVIHIAMRIGIKGPTSIAERSCTILMTCLIKKPGMLRPATRLASGTPPSFASPVRPVH